jgi:hypothetical protein
MVKPPLRTKSIGFKVSEEEYAQLETAARTSGRTLGEWCREVVFASASDAERHDPALAEIVGVRLLAGGPGFELPTRSITVGAPSLRCWQGRV